MKTRRHHPLHLIGTACIAVLLVACLSACKSNTKLNRGMKAMTTKYNIYYNGNEAYKEGLTAMEKKHDEEFGQRIQLHPVYKLTDAKEPPANAQFDRAIEKCKIAVQRRSISNKPKRRGKNTPEYKLWLTHGEFNPFLHNAWLLSGKAQFYKGDFNAAAATFAYTARRFWWRKYTVAECHIWAARVFAVQGFNFDAEAELGLVISPKQYSNQKELSALPVYKDLPRSLQKAFSLAQAEILLCKPETSLVLQIVNELDPNAFVSIADVKGVFGAGFDKIKTK